MARAPRSTRAGGTRAAFLLLGASFVASCALGHGIDLPHSDDGDSGSDDGIDLPGSGGMSAATGGGGPTGGQGGEGGLGGSSGGGGKAARGEP